jgi:hypothetical protein
MSSDRLNKQDVDELLKQVLRDDLPADVESGMRKRLALFRRTLDPAGRPDAARSAGSRDSSFGLVRWLGRHQLFQKEVLACASAVMLAAGAAIHLGGYQNVLADSITLLKTSMSLTEQMRLAGTMECVMKAPVAGTEPATYHIRWLRDGRTRVDLQSERGAREVWWISQGQVTGSGSDADLPQPVQALLSPAGLAAKMEKSWQLQHAEDWHSRGRLVFVDRQEPAVIEMRFDTNSRLPISMSRKPSQSGGTVGMAMTAEFTWNQPIAPELMIPQPKSRR